MHPVFNSPDRWAWRPCSILKLVLAGNKKLVPVESDLRAGFPLVR